MYLFLRILAGKNKILIYILWPKNKKMTWNCRKCPHAGFKCLISQYKQSIFSCSKSKILGAQPWCLALYSWKAEKRWFVRYDTSATFWPCSWCHWYRLLDTKCQHSWSQVNVFVTYNRFFNEQEQWTPAVYFIYSIPINNGMNCDASLIRFANKGQQIHDTSTQSLQSWCTKRWQAVV